MTSPWSDGIANDFEAPAHYTVDPDGKITQHVAVKSSRYETAHLEKHPDYWRKCDCADCRALVALLEEPIDKP